MSAVLAQNAPVVLPPLHGQLQPLPTTWDATGRYYLPSVSSLGLQDPAIRAQEIIAQSQYPFGLDHTRDENQDWYPQARYSPSQEGRVLTYNPVQAAPGITKGEHPARQAAGEDLSSAMVRAPAGIQMTAPRAPGGAVRLIPRRGIIVEGVAQETEHTNVLALFPVSDFGWSNMGRKLTQHSDRDMVPWKESLSSNFMLRADFPSCSPIFARPLMPSTRFLGPTLHGISSMPPSRR